MRRLIVSMHVTIDGFISGPHGELDWHFKNWTPDMADSMCCQLSNADTILLGRNTYNAMAAYWPAVSEGLDMARDDIAFAWMMNNYTKIVCSTTLDTLSWNNSRLIKGNLLRQILQLKQQEGKDIIIYGSGKLVRYLARHSVVDEYRLWVYPVSIGRGITLFKNKLNMKLLKTQSFPSGVIILNYEACK
jgi:dihydrofolate reductase